MKRPVVAIAAALLCIGLAFPGTTFALAPAAHVGPSPLVPRLIASFPTGYEYNSFAESLALSRTGDLYATVTIWQDATWNTGQLWRIMPDGEMRQLGADLEVGILSGLAFDDAGNLYAGLITFDRDGVPSGVLRFAPDGTATRAVTLPAGAFPNGLAFHGGYLYISDSSWGAVWRARPGADVR